MLLFAVARIVRYKRVYYVPVEDGEKVGWTGDLDAAWADMHQPWAEAVRWALAREGFHDTFLHVFRIEIGGEGTFPAAGR